jgi:hypothetical protein
MRYQRSPLGVLRVDLSLRRVSSNYNIYAKNVRGGALFFFLTHTAERGTGRWGGEHPLLRRGVRAAR